MPSTVTTPYEPAKNVAILIRHSRPRLGAGKSTGAALMLQSRSNNRWSRQPRRAAIKGAGMANIRFCHASTVANVPEGDVIGVDVEGNKVALCKLDGTIYALQGFCTHGHAELAGGYLEGDLIYCPM